MNWKNRLSFQIGPNGLNLLLTILISLPFFFLITEPTPRFQVESIETGWVDKADGIQKYLDIDQDGISEEALVFTDLGGELGLKITDEMDRIRVSMRIGGKMPRNGTPIASFQLDGETGLALIHQQGDSLLLDILHPIKNSFSCLNSHFLCQVSLARETYDYSINPFFVFPSNPNRSEDLVFSINAGSTLSPRRVFLYRSHARKLLQTPDLGTQLTPNHVADLNNDGFPEIFCQSYAPYNFPPEKKILLPDSCAYVVVLDSTLNFFFPPIPFGGFTSNVQPFPYFMNGKPHILVRHSGRAVPAIIPTLSLLHPSGKMLNQIPLSDTSQTSRFCFLGKHPFQEVYLAGWDGKIHQIESNLQLSLKSEIPAGIGVAQRIDINLDNRTEYFSSYKNAFLILDEEMQDYILVPAGIEALGGPQPSVNHTANGKHFLFVQSGKQFQQFAYQTNPIFPWRYPILLGVLLLVFLFVSFIGWIQKSLLKRRLAIEQQISTLQYNLLSNQLEPHFLFNAINSVAELMEKQSKEEASHYLTQMSRLLQLSLIYSDRIVWSIREEIEFTLGFLSIQELRFPEKIASHIHISQEVDMNASFPRMMLQSICENAVKHGLANKEEGGKILITVRREKEHILFMVEDDGIGRAAAGRKSTPGTGSGTKNLQYLVSLFNKHHRAPIHFSIEDRFSQDGMAAGTCVHLRIPRHFSMPSTRVFEKLPSPNLN